MTGIRPDTHLYCRHHHCFAAFYPLIYTTVALLLLPRPHASGPIRKFYDPASEIIRHKLSSSKSPTLSHRSFPAILQPSIRNPSQAFKVHIKVIPNIIITFTHLSPILLIGQCNVNMFIFYDKISLITFQSRLETRYFVNIYIELVPITYSMMHAGCIMTYATKQKTSSVLLTSCRLS